MQANQLRPWEPISQLRTWAPDEAYGNERSEECGQACIVMCLRYCSGVYTSAAYLHDLVHPAGSVVGTDWPEMQSTLRYMETASMLVQPAASDVRAVVEQSIDRGHPLIALRWFDHAGNMDSAGNPVLHFTCITGYTPTLIQQAGPWSGTMFTETDETFAGMYYPPSSGGGLLIVQRTRRLGDH